jgi:hypothetical protein
MQFSYGPACWAGCVVTGQNPELQSRSLYYLLTVTNVTNCSSSSSSSSNSSSRVVVVVIRFVVLPFSTYLFTAGVEVVYFHLITLRLTPQSAGLLWTRDRPVAETST